MQEHQSKNVETNTALQAEIQVRQQQEYDLQQEIQALRQHAQLQNAQLEHQQQTIARLRAQIEILQNHASDSAPPSPFTGAANDYNRKYGRNAYAAQDPNNINWMRACALEMDRVRRNSPISDYIREVTDVLNFFQRCTEDTIFCNMGIQRITNVNIRFTSRTRYNPQDETTLFIEAIKTGQLTFVQSIYNILAFAPNTRVDLNATDGKSRTPLDIAIEYGYEDIIEWLRSKRATTSKQSDSQLAKRGKTDDGKATWSNNNNNSNSSSSNSIQMCERGDGSCLDHSISSSGIGFSSQM